MNSKNIINNVNDSIIQKSCLSNINNNKYRSKSLNNLISSLKKEKNNNSLNNSLKRDEKLNDKAKKNFIYYKNKQMKKSESQKIIENKNKINYQKKKQSENNYELNKLIFPLKNNKKENAKENNINIKLIMNKDINFYRTKNINSNKNLNSENKLLNSNQNNKIKVNNKKNIFLKRNRDVKKNNDNNILIYGKPNKNQNIVYNNNNDINLNFFSERKSSKFFGNEIKHLNSLNSFINSLSKRNSLKEIYDNKNNINIIKEEKEIENKKSEENSNSNVSETSENLFDFDDSNSCSNYSLANHYKKDLINNKRILFPKVEVKTETNLDKLYSKYKRKINLENKIHNKSFSSKNRLKFKKPVMLNLQYLKNSKLNKSNTLKYNHKHHICFIMNDDIISDNKNTTIISLGTSTKKNKNIDLQKYQTNDTEINKIQDILSHGDKTFSELAYDKGVSEVVEKIPSPNSHRGSKDVVPKSIKNPNENYGPFKSLFSFGLDRKDESSFSSSPCVSRSNSSSKVVKIITGFKKNKNKHKNLKKNEFIEDDKEKINNNNYYNEEDKKEEIIINDNNKENGSDKKIKGSDDNDKKDLEIYPEPIWSEQDTELSSKLKNDLNNEIFNKFSDLMNKLKNVSNNNEIINESNENKEEEFEEDYNLLNQMTSEFEKLEEIYKKECDKINEKIFKMSRLMNFILQQSFPNNHSLQNSISSFSQRLEKMDNQYNKEIKNYKKTIQNLIDQLQNLSGENNENAIDKNLLQEIKDIEFSEHQIFNTFLENKNYSNDDKNSENFDKKELIEELERFKNEEKEYKFSIPQKYSLDTNRIKLIKNGIIKGLFVKVYENKVIDIINKHGTTKRIFPDGFQISFYNNKDIKLRYNNKDEFCFYHVNQTEEFRFPSKGIIVYKFKNGQFEKHYSNYELNIKFSDGSYRIIRKEKELFQYPDGIFEFKDKKGKKSYMDSINDIEEGLSKSVKIKSKKNKK